MRVLGIWGLDSHFEAGLRVIFTFFYTLLKLSFHVRRFCSNKKYNSEEAFCFGFFYWHYWSGLTRHRSGGVFFVSILIIFCLKFVEFVVENGFTGFS